MTMNGMLAAVAILALLIGAGLGYWLGARRGRRADARVAKAEAELSAYRASVTEHFQLTAVRFRELGEQYLSLHQHLAEGAESLCDVSRDEARLRFAPPTALAAPATDTGAAAAVDAAKDEATDPEQAAEPMVATRAAAPLDYELPAMSSDDRPSAPDAAAAAEPADTGLPEKAADRDAAAASDEGPPEAREKKAEASRSDDGETDEAAVGGAESAPSESAERRHTLH